MNAGRPRVYIKLLFLAVILTMGVSGVLMASAYEITGHIGNDHDTDLLEGASVNFVDATGVVIAEDDTDATGAYSVTIDAGTYAVYVYPPSSSDYSGFYHESFQVFEHDDYVGQWNLHYFTTASVLSGNIYTTGGGNVENGVKVHLFDGEFFYPSLTAGGAYSITTPADGVYEMEVTGAVGHVYYFYPFLEITNGYTKDLVLASVAGSNHITGVLTDSVYGTFYEDFWVVYESIGDPKYGPYACASNSLGEYEVYAHPGITYNIHVYTSDEFNAQEYIEEDYTTEAPAAPRVQSYEIENPFPITVNIEDGSTEERVYFADHTNSETDGNYITLSTGDITIDLPAPMEVNYAGPQDSEHEYEGKMIYFNSAFEEKNVVSPIETWELYYAPATVEIVFNGDDRLENKVVDVRLLNEDYDDVVDAISDAKNGDLQPLKNMLAAPEDEVTRTLTGDGEFDSAVSFAAIPVGDYAIVIVKESFDPYELYVYSVAPVEVLDYEITVTLENPLDPSDFDLQMWVNFEEPPAGTEYSYACILVKEDAYSLYSDVETDGTIDGTTTYVQHQGADPMDPYLVASNGELLGIPYSNYMDLLDYNLINEELGNIYQLNQYSMGSALETTETVNVLLSPDTDETFQGQYVLITIVWEHDTGNRIVAFDQQLVALGQSITIDSITPILPDFYGNIVDISYVVTSDSVYAGSSAEITFSIDGSPIPTATDTVSIDIDSSTQTFDYEWDTLITVPRNPYRHGGTVEVTITLYDASSTQLATLSTTGTLNAATKPSVYSGRINPLALIWNSATDAEKPSIYSTYINPLALLWNDLE